MFNIVKKKNFSVWFKKGQMIMSLWHEPNSTASCNVKRFSCYVHLLVVRPHQVDLNSVFPEYHKNALPRWK